MERHGAIHRNDGEDCPIGSYWHDRRVTVAGGSGFIGSYLVDELLEAGAYVTVADKITDDYIPRVSLDEGIGDMIDWYERTFTG